MFCPKCGEQVQSRERRPNGNSTCTNRHVFPTSQEVRTQPQPLEVVAVGSAEEDSEVYQVILQGSKEAVAAAGALLYERVRLVRVT